MTLKEHKYLFAMSLIQPDRISPDRSAFILLTTWCPDSFVVINSRGLKRKYCTVLPVPSKGCNAVPGNQVLPRTDNILPSSSIRTLLQKGSDSPLQSKLVLHQQFLLSCCQLPNDELIMHFHEGQCTHIIKNNDAASILHDKVFILFIQFGDLHKPLAGFPFQEEIHGSHRCYFKIRRY